MNAVVQMQPEEPCVELVGWQNPYLMLGNAVAAANMALLH